MRDETTEPREWWKTLSQGERRLICSLMGLLRGAKRCQVAEVARAAAKWERGIGCFIKVRLMGQAARATASRSGKRVNGQRTVSITVEPVSVVKN